jgi:hypothetical protein
MTGGFPDSKNRASSFHLWWEPPPPPADEVSVTLTIDSLPRHPHLVFWALQVSFADDWGRTVGGAHLGLQWNSRHPLNRAVNWGGYDAGGSLLAGTASELASRPDDPNTRDLAWTEGRAYRLVVSRGSEPGRWLGSVVDTVTGDRYPVRELAVEATGLIAPVVWTECFARCDDPSVSAMWSGPLVAGAGGGQVPRAYRVSYQAADAGGCANTDVDLSHDGVRQVTSVVRQTPHGALIPVV